MYKKLKKTTRIEIENSGCNLACFDPSKSEILADIKRIIYKDLEVMVYRMEVTCDEIVDLLIVKINAGTTIGYTLPPGI